MEILIILIIIPAIIFSFLSQKRVTEDFSFRWGFFLAYSTILIIIFLFVFSMLLELVISPADLEKMIEEILHSHGRSKISLSEDSIFEIFFVSLNIGGLISALFTLKRHKWAFIMLTALSFNPIFWIAHYFYITIRKGFFLEDKVKAPARVEIS